MIENYLIVSKKILPDYYAKVVEARVLLETIQCKSVSDAVKRVGISRSTYYKYKDYIFTPSEDYGRKFTLSFKLEDQQGILAKILALFKEQQTNVITIHQDIPINHFAVVIITLDGKDLIGNIDDLILQLEKIKGIHRIQLIAME